MVMASWAVGSYACGSVFGLVMMLVTATWLPPSWLAMLPQKFSVATTASRWLAIDGGLGAALVLQPASVAAVTAAKTRSAAGRMPKRNGRDVSDMERLLGHSALPAP